MILRKLQNDPAKMIPVAMALVVVGLSILTIGIAWPRLFPSSLFTHTGTDWNDFFRGFMFGLAITLELGGVVLATMALKRRQSL